MSSGERLSREEREIEEACRRGYGERPQEEWIGEAGLAAFSALVAEAREDAEPP